LKNENGELRPFEIETSEKTLKEFAAYANLMKIVNDQLYILDFNQPQRFWYLKKRKIKKLILFLAMIFGELLQILKRHFRRLLAQKREFNRQSRKHCHLFLTPPTALFNRYSHNC